MSENTPQPTHDAAAILKAQKRRNVWLALALVAFVVIVGVSTVVRLQQSDFSGGDRLYFSGYLDEAAKDKRNREAEERARAADATESDTTAAQDPDDE